MSAPIRIGTRGSKLALWQANAVATALRQTGYAIEIDVIRTTGDRRTDVSLAEIGGKGLFIKEIEEALLARRIDLAVHSLKDVPSVIPVDFELAGFLERADPRDAWVHPSHAAVETLPAGTVVGTSSPRRSAQLRSLFPHLQVRSIRGNVDTRLAKTRSGEYAGTVLAAAGLTRLGWESHITSRFSIERMTPAAGQGIVAIEILRERSDMRRAAQSISHGPTELAGRSERRILENFEEQLDCYSSIGVHAALSDSTMAMTLFISDQDGRESVRINQSAPLAEKDRLIESVSDQIRATGAIELLQPGTRT